MKNLLTTRLPRIRAAVFALTLLHLPAAWAQGDGDQNSGPAIDIAEAGAAGLDQDKTLPIEIHPGSPMADLVSLANSGVGQEVIMGFVTGSTRMFNLSAEQIIYLKDIGLGGFVTSRSEPTRPARLPTRRPSPRPRTRRQSPTFT